jgi:hypothetical protein
MKTIYIYTLEHPLTGEIRYVGKTVNPKKRESDHCSKSVQLLNQRHLSKWILSLLNQGLKPKMTIIDSTDLIDWQWLEIYWISQFKTWGFNLTNNAIGGNSNHGFKMSEEFCKKQSQLKKGRKQSKEQIDNFRERIKGNTYCRGEKNRNSKITESDVIKICQLLNAGVKSVEISKQIPNCTPNSVGLIKMRKTWNHITKNLLK